jgi:Domain of unknown function (DUF4340)
MAAARRAARRGAAARRAGLVCAKKMNSKTTGIWFVIAAIMCAGIFAVQYFVRPAMEGPSAVLPHFYPSAVTSVRVIPAGQLEIRADRTNGNWLVTRPIFYPGQSAAIETLLDALQKLVPAPRISAAEMRDNKNAETEFGFVHPQISLDIQADEQRWQLDIGNKTAPGNQVYLRVIGVEGAFVVDADWLKWIPSSADMWRDTSLIAANQNNFDWILLTNDSKVIELRRNPTNRLWRMIRPLQARADGDHIANILQQLRAAHVTQFVADDAKADLTAYGLQPADLDLWLGNQTNFTTALHVGKSPADDSTQAFAKRENWNAIFKIQKDAVAPWRGTVNDFRDTRLVDLTANAAEIEMRGARNFILQQHGSNDWTIAGEKFPADAQSAQAFLKILSDLRVTEFTKDVVTPPDLPAYGLDAPQQQIILRSAIGDSNAVIAQLNFGTNRDDKIFVQRADEDFIYAVAWKDFHAMPDAAWQLRDRHIWNFNPNDVAQITLRQNGRTRQIIRSGTGKWSLAPGSQGIITGDNIEKSVERLSQLTAGDPQYGPAAWVGRNQNPPEWGFAPDNLQITIELKDGKKFTVEFGLPIEVRLGGQRVQTAFAAVALDGERWTFEFPPETYLFVSTYLTIPANVP